MLALPVRLPLLSGSTVAARRRVHCRDQSRMLAPRAILIKVQLSREILDGPWTGQTRLHPIAKDDVYHYSQRDDGVY